MRFLPDIRPDTVPYQIPVPNNMGVVRYYLAFSVIIAHFALLTGADGWWWPTSSDDAVGAFFALSGFLIYGSYLKKPLFGQFLKSRMRRLLPAYAGVVLFFAFVLGAVSSLPLADYYLSGGFAAYLAANLSFLNFLHPSLPGVFDGNVMTAVNGSLWTMKVEWTLYLSVPFVFWIIKKTRWAPQKMFVALYIFSYVYRVGFAELYNTTGNEMFSILGRQFLGQLMYFYSGVLIYFYYSSFMRYRWQILVFSLICMAVNGHIPYLDMALRPLYVAMLAMLVSMSGKWGAWESRYENVSYNMYLIHFPVIQLYAASGMKMHFLAALAVVTAVVVVLSVALNRFVERPFRKQPRAVAAASAT